MKQIMFILSFFNILFAQSTDWYNASDTKFRISTVEQLKGLAQLVNDGTSNFAEKTITLEQNIDLNGKDFIPIGNSDANSFQGIFDGNGNTILNLSVNGYRYAGLFGYVKNGQIKNLNVTAKKIKTIATSDTTYAGGLAGYYNSTKSIDNCKVEADSIIATATGPYARSFSGGLAGSAGLVNNVDTITIKNSYANVNISATVTGSWAYSYSGGLVGAAAYPGYINIMAIKNSYAVGNASDGKYSGGLVGTATTILIEDSYASGKVSGTNSGGLIGETVGTGTIRNSYTTGNISAIGCSGGLVGISSSMLKIENSYTDGDVSSYLINNSTNDEIISNSGGLVGLSYNAIVISNSHTHGNISSTISDISGKILHATTYSGGLVANVGRTTANVDKIVTIKNSYTTGTVSATAEGSSSMYIISYSGGLVGNAGKIDIIEKSYTSGKISANASHEAYSGGLIGYSNNAIVESSYTSGDISANASRFAYSGGLAGDATIDVSNSYTNGKVSSDANKTYSGGLIGNYNGGTIKNSYASGSVSGPVSGGIFGFFSCTELTYTSVFYNSEEIDVIAGDVFNAHSTCRPDAIAGIFGKSSTDLKKKTTFTGWDFGSVWGIDECKGYPYLIALPPSANGNNDNSSCEDDTPILLPQISSYDQIIKVRNGINLLVKNNAVVEIFSLNGVMINRQFFVNGNHSVSLSHLSKGMYIAKITFNDKKMILKIPVM